MALLLHTQTIDDFRYYANGTLVTTFEPGGLDRYGSEPDRFVEQMRQVGLPTAVDDDDRAADPMIALLQMLTVALGIYVPSDLALGPLLTVQRETPLPRPPVAARPVAVRAEQIRPHLQRLIASGVTADAIAARTGNWLSPVAIDAVLRGRNMTISIRVAEQVLAIEVPPN